EQERDPAQRRHRAQRLGAGLGRLVGLARHGFLSSTGLHRSLGHVVAGQGPPGGPGRSATSSAPYTCPRRVVPDRERVLNTSRPVVHTVVHRLRMSSWDGVDRRGAAPLAFTPRRGPRSRWAAWARGRLALSTVAGGLSFVRPPISGR